MQTKYKADRDDVAKAYNYKLVLREMIWRRYNKEEYSERLVKNGLLVN